MKYPRTYHLPFSPGATKDDKKLQPGWFEYYRGKEDEHWTKNWKKTELCTT